MQILSTKEDRAFRKNVRKWISENLPNSLKYKVQQHKRLERRDYECWHSILQTKGWYAVNWPKNYGGAGWTSLQQYIFEEECVMAFAPRVIPFGVKMLGPVLIEFGNEEQKTHFLPRILRGDDWWAQGYSENNAGSDLAAIETKATREGDYYIVNGHKTWTTFGHFANMLFCLCRTGSRRTSQWGMSFLLIDLASKGVSIQPILTLDGEHEINEIHLQDVKVPVSNRIGEENKGWKYASYILRHERAGIGGVAQCLSMLSSLKEIAHKEKKEGRPLIDDYLFASEIAKIEIDVMALEYFNWRTLLKKEPTKMDDLTISLLKIRGSELRQRLSKLLLKAVGPFALPYLHEEFSVEWHGSSIGPEHASPLARQYFNMRKLSIYGGTNEIQRNILAKRYLRL